MEHLKYTIQKRMLDKILWKQAIGVLVLRELKKIYPQVNFDAYVKFDTVFLQSVDKWFQILLYKDKPKILKILNTKLSSLWYKEKLRKIMFKPGKFTSEM